MPYPKKGECRNTGRTRFKKGSKVNVGKKASKETREKMSKMRKGIHKSPETEFKRGHKTWQGFREKTSRWKGGILYHPNGYVYLYQPDHPRARPNYVRRCILVMEKHLGRFLNPQEIVHHRGIHFPIKSIENKQDDSLENLELFPNISKHTHYHNIIRHQSQYPSKLS